LSMKIDMKLKKRKATTLIELVVVLVMMGLFIMMVFNMFSVTYDGYLFNREMAARMYAQTNIDNFFEIFERELMYSGSMDMIIKEFDSLKILPGGNDFLHIATATNDATITTRYALAEKIILTKAFQDYYYQLVGTTSPASLSETDNASKTYFALFDSSFHSTISENGLWSLGYNNMSTDSFPTLFTITGFSTELFTRTDGKTFTGVIIEEKDGVPITDVNVGELKTFISPLLYEKSFESLNNPLVMLTPNASWTGEMIYKTEIFTIPQEGSDKKTLVLRKRIPTIDASYTIKLMDDIHSFQAATSPDDTYVATVVHTFTIPGTTKEGTITVNRKFLKTNTE